MSYTCAIVADSIAPHGGRITTFQLRFPRFILAQFNTHRAISRNARSSRAVPVEKLIKEVENNPVRPLYWGANRGGMQATEVIDPQYQIAAEYEWNEARLDAVFHARELSRYGAHKQIVNRVLEPFLWVDVVATATDWMNFFALRCDRHAQPEIQKIAVMMARAYRDSTPTQLSWYEWHLPYMTPEELGTYASALNRDDPWGATSATETVLKFSVARCARVSYRTHDGKVPDIDADIKLYDRLAKGGHWSPFEHQAFANRKQDVRSGNFRGWGQYRQWLPTSVHESFDFAKLDDFGEEGFLI